MKHFLHLTIAVIITTGSLKSQATLNSWELNPVNGDINILKTVPYSNPGSAGANQTYNFSSLIASASATQNFSGLSASFSSSYPNASIQMSGSSEYRFFTITTNALQFSGYVPPVSSYSSTYSNPEDVMRYPFNYNDTYTDNWVATQSFLNTTQTGTTLVTYDGYGTLMLPYANFNNVARVHAVQSYVQASSSFTATTVIDQYLWYLAGNHFPIAGMITATSNGGNPQQTGFYSANAKEPITTGLPATKKVSAINLFPNPASDFLNLNFLDQSIKEISLFNTEGKMIFTTKVQNTSELTALDLRDYASGLYFLKFKNSDGLIETKKIVLAR